MWKDLQLPRVELAGDEVVVAADELEGSVGHAFLDEGVGGEVLEGHVDGLLQKLIREYLLVSEEAL